jgi:hypothetical protein
MLSFHDKVSFSNAIQHSLTVHTLPEEGEYRPDMRWSFLYVFYFIYSSLACWGLGCRVINIADHTLPNELNLIYACHLLKLDFSFMVHWLSLVCTNFSQMICSGQSRHLSVFFFFLRLQISEYDFSTSLHLKKNAINAMQNMLSMLFYIYMFLFVFFSLLTN